MNNWQNNLGFQLSLVLILAVYAVLFNVGAVGFGWFPSFDMSPQVVEYEESTHYDLRFTEVNGIALDPPVYFSEADEWVPENSIFDGRRLINRLGIAAHQDDMIEVRQLEREFVRAYAAQLISAEYQIVLIVKNPVEKYHLEEYFSEELIETFSFDRSTLMAGTN